MHVDPDIALYCVDLVTATRGHRDVQVGASPRGAQGLMLVGRARAVMDGRDFVAPEDIKAAAVPVLAHRISLTPQAWANGVDAAAVIGGIVGQVAGPPAVGLREPAGAEGSSAGTAAGTGPAAGSGAGTGPAQGSR
ncbi:hypothetical protein GCM10025867_02590 [Frondihabitans sucicola]|uniref:ChlI/MoxR AAA lid domain-containing protein n=1 Tax=Frondihabitans sucicola TaxID=1268041 RepID=A0ABM8GI25_9MICO|nr:hypothetical protein GCM10025867_02590 [Frondihabitans sucicola]